MKNLIQFILRFHAHFVFLLLLTVSGFLLIQYNHYQKSTFFNSYTRISGGVNKVREASSHYFALDVKNKQLAEENKLLKNFLIGKHEDNWIGQMANDTLQKGDYRFSSARVVNLTTFKKLNYITINKGRKHGVKQGMAIFSNQGAVGIVKGTAPNFSIVLPIINTRSRVSSRIDSSGHFGTLIWEGISHNVAQLRGIEQNAKIKVGQPVYTTGYGASFPSGVLVGSIKSFNPDAEGLFYDIEIELATNFKKLYYVTIADHTQREELEALESSELYE